MYTVNDLSPDLKAIVNNVKLKQNSIFINNEIETARSENNDIFVLNKIRNTLTTYKNDKITTKNLSKNE